MGVGGRPKADGSMFTSTYRRRPVCLGPMCGSNNETLISAHQSLVCVLGGCRGEEKMEEQWDEASLR